MCAYVYQSVVCVTGVGAGGHARPAQCPGGYAGSERPVRGAAQEADHCGGAGLQPLHCLHG